MAETFEVEFVRKGRPVGGVTTQGECVLSRDIIEEMNTDVIEEAVVEPLEEEEETE